MLHFPLKKQMNESLIAFGILVFFLGGFFIVFPKARLSLLKNIALFVFVGVIGMGVIFEESIGGEILESMDFVGLIQKPAAEAFAAEKFGGTSLYSWYGFEKFRPAIFVMIDQNGVQKKIVLQAFSGNILEQHAASVASNISFDDFLKQKDDEASFPTEETKIETSKLDTDPPKIEITSPKDGQVFDAATEKIKVTADIWDAVDPAPILDGIGEYVLQPGFNSIIVTGSDKSGNVASAFVVVEKQ